MDKQNYNGIALQEKEESDSSIGIVTCAGGAPKRVWLFGHFGVGNGLGNFGNDSTLLAVLYNLRRLLPNVDVNCICTAPAITAANYNINALPVSRSMIQAWKPGSRAGRAFRSLVFGVPCEIYRWLDGLMTFRRTDVVIVPGTGLISDAYGLRGWGPYSLFKWSLIAKIRGCKWLFLSVGAGPVYGRVGRFFVKSALGLANYRSYRDESSREYLRSIGFANTGDRVYPDLAFSLPQSLFDQQSGNNKSPGATRPRRVVGVGVMLYAGKYSVEDPDDRTQQRYLDNLVTFVAWLLAQDYDVRLLVGDLCDRPVIKEFKRLLREYLPDYDDRRLVEEDVVSVEQLLKQLYATDLVVATRFHNALLALLCQKPVVAISFHHKVASLMDSMGLSEYCLDINDFSGEDVIAKVRAVEREVGNLKTVIRNRAEHCRAALEEQYERTVEELTR